MKRSFVLILCSIFFIGSFGLYKIAVTDTAHFDLDSHGYDRIGSYYAQTNKLFDPSQGSVIPVQTLGYPFFLGIIYKIFGHDIKWVIMAQVLLSIVAIYLLSCIAQALFDESVALVVIILGSLNLGFLIYSQFILTEILLTTILIAGFERLVYYFKYNCHKALALSGFWYGLSVTVKPVGLVYVIILLFFIAVFSYLNRLNLLKSLLLFSCSFYAPVLGYMVHNQMQFGVMRVAPVMYENIYFYFLAKIIAHNAGISWYQGLEKLKGLIGDKDQNDSSRWKEPKKLMHALLFNQPFFIAKLWLFNVLKTFGGLYSSQLKFLVNPTLKGTDTSFFSKDGSLLNRCYLYVTDGIENRFIQIFTVWYLLYHFIQYVFVAIAFFVLFYQKRYFFINFVLVSICYFALITGHDGCARYRMMFEYFFILFAAFGMVVLYRWLKNKKMVHCQLAC